MVFPLAILRMGTFDLFLLAHSQTTKLKLFQNGALGKSTDLTTHGCCSDRPALVDLRRFQLWSMGSSQGTYPRICPCTVNDRWGTSPDSKPDACTSITSIESYCRSNIKSTYPNAAADNLSTHRRKPSQHAQICRPSSTDSNE